MAWTPYVESEQSKFDSPLVFEHKADAEISAQDRADRLRSHYLVIKTIEARETNAEPNHVLRDGLLVRIGWSTSKP